MFLTLLRSVVHELTAAFNPGEWVSLFGKLRQTNRQKLLAAVRTLLPQMLIYYVLLSPPVAAPLYNLMLFHPTMTGPYDAHSIVGCKIENVHFAGKSGKMLHGWYLRALAIRKSNGGKEANGIKDANSSKKTCAIQDAYGSETSKADSAAGSAKQVVLISHGNGGNLTNRIPLIAMFLRDGVSVFIYDYQGYGRSEGSPGLKTIVDDGNAAFDWLLAKKGYRASEVILFGESLGSGVACQLAARRQDTGLSPEQARRGEKPAGGIILQSAYTSLVDLAGQKILWLRLYPRSFFEEPLDNEAILSQPHAPLLLVHGKKDRLISIAHSERIYQTALAPKTIVRLPDAGHNDIYDVDCGQYGGAVEKFLLSLKQ